MVRLGLCVILFAAACSADTDLASDDYMPEDLPPWTCDTEGTTTGCDSTGGGEQSCNQTQDCAGAVCAASFNGDIGPFECQASCIEPMDDTRWCSDAAACCDAGAICDRGYCVGNGGADTSGGSSSETGVADTSTGTDGGSSTGAADTGSTSSTGTGA